MKAEGQRSSLQRPTFLLVAVALLLLGGASGCSPKIGEDCTTSIDCSLNGDRLCDMTQPGGYCTVFNCEPNGCPEGAVCVAFNETTCSEPAVSNRFRRTFCMKTCESDDDCRGGEYRCLDTSREPGRPVVDINPVSRNICAVPSGTAPLSTPDASTPKEPAVCSPSDASFDTSRPEAGASDGLWDGADAAKQDAASDTGDARDAQDAVSERTDTSPGDAPTDARDGTTRETGIVADVQEEPSTDGSSPEDARDDGETGAGDAPTDGSIDAGETPDSPADAPVETGD